MEQTPPAEASLPGRPARNPVFQDVLGEDWFRLGEIVRRHYFLRPFSDDAICVEGTMHEVWFRDEARSGQKNGLVRHWARRGTRPTQPADQRYDSAYLFGAICPTRGLGAALALPFADTDAMQRHIDEIVLNAARGANAALLLDRAG